MLLLLLGCAIEQRSFATDTAADTDTAAETDTAADTDTAVDTDTAADTHTAADTAPPALTLGGTCTFDGTPLGCGTECTIELTNTGGADLTLVGAHLESTTSAAFSLSQNFPDGVVLGPLETTSATVFFNPIDEAPATGALHLYSDDPVNPEQTFPFAGIAGPAATCP